MFKTTWRLIFSLLALVLLLTACGRETPNMVREDFPQKLSTRVRINSQKPQEVDRWVYMNGDLKTLEQIQYVDGVTTYVFFRPDETAEKIVELHPVQSGEEKRRLKTEVIFEADGLSYASHKALRLDGTLIKEGRRLEDRTYSTTTFFEDGVTRQKISIYKADKSLVSELEVDRDGTKLLETVTDSDNYLVSKSWRRDGTLAMQYKKPPYAYGGVSGTYYEADGVTVKAEFSMTSWQSSISFANVSGKRLEFSFDSRGAKRMNVLVSDANGVPLYQQFYAHDGKSPFDLRGNYTLAGVEEYDGTGNRYNRKLKRRITMGADGKSIAKVFVPQSQWYDYSGIEYTLYPSGFIQSKKSVGWNVQPNQQNFQDGASTDPIVVVNRPELSQMPQVEKLSLPDIKLPEVYWYW